MILFKNYILVKDIYNCQILLFGGCSKNQEASRFENYKHYTMSRKDVLESTQYISDDGSVYLIADITPSENDLSKVYGLLYNISGEDYVLLDEIDLGRMIEKSHTYFCKNKLYITECYGLCNLEYTLDKEKFSKKGISFDTSEISDSIMIGNILKGEDGFIYLKASDVKNSSIFDGREIEIKCTIDFYKCNINEEKVEK